MYGIECLHCFDMLASIDPTVPKEKNEKRTTLIIHIERTWYSEFNYFRWKYNSAPDLGKGNICYIRQKKSNLLQDGGGRKSVLWGDCSDVCFKDHQLENN